MEVLSPGWTFVIYAAVCAGGLLLVWRIYPETTGLELEEVRGLLETGWGVRESQERWEAWRAKDRMVRTSGGARRKNGRRVEGEDDET